MTRDQARWIVEWVTHSASLLFIWHGQHTQPQAILMPGWVYHWWKEPDGTRPLRLN